MAKKRARSSHWLNQQWWRFALSEWIGLTLGFLAVVLLFCLFFIRRHTLEYHLDHTLALTKSAGRAAYGRMLEGGVKIFEYQPTMIHTKSMVVDGLFAMFRSSNLDARSSEINEELDLVVYDEKFGHEAEAIYEKDLDQAREYTLEEFKKRSLWERTTEWLMLPFRSQL